MMRINCIGVGGTREVALGRGVPEGAVPFGTNREDREMKKLMTLMAGVAMLALFMPMQASAQSGQYAKSGLVVVITPGPVAAEEIKRLEEHAGVRIYRSLDRDAEFQEPLLSQPRPGAEQPEKEEAREEQREPPEGCLILRPH